MIKLFWNTQNQKNDPNDKEDRALIWGKYHKDYSDKWIYEILKEVQFEIIENENVGVVLQDLTPQSQAKALQELLKLKEDHQQQVILI